LLIFLDTVYFGSCAKAGYILSLSVVCHFVPINNVKLWSAPTITAIESILLCSAWVLCFSAGDRYDQRKSYFDFSSTV